MQLGGHAEFVCPFIWSHDAISRQTNSDDATFLSRVITGEESWIYGYDPETKQQSSQWKSPNSLRPKKSEIGEEQNENHAHHFLLHLGDCSQKICPLRPDSQFCLLL
jgi:hypothetical protein